MLKVVGTLLIVTAIVLLVSFYFGLPSAGVESKGDDIVIWGLNLNALVSLLSGVVALFSGVATLVAAARKRG